MILVDPLTKYPTSMTRGLPSDTWCHMVSDTSEEELHAFAAKLGLLRRWFQGGGKGKSPAHYDLVASKRALAVRFGAYEVTSRELALSNYDGTFRRAGRAEQGPDGKWRLKAGASRTVP